MNHTALDRIEQDIRDNINSLAFGLTAAYELGKRERELPPDPPSACGCNCCTGCAQDGIVATLKGRLAYIRRELEAIEAHGGLDKVSSLERHYLIGRIRDAATRPLTRDMGYPCSPSHHYDPARNEPDIGDTGE